MFELHPVWFGLVLSSLWNSEVFSSLKFYKIKARNGKYENQSNVD